jgi:hypothetical protein
MSIVLAVVAIPAFLILVLLHDGDNKYQQRQIQSELDQIAETGRPSARLSEYRYICFHDEYGTRGEKLLQAAAKSGTTSQCGVRNSCCFKATDSDIPALIGLVRDQQIECFKIGRFPIVLEPSRAACIEPSRLKISREVFKSNDPRVNTRAVGTRIGDSYYKIEEKGP